MSASLVLAVLAVLAVLTLAGITAAVLLWRRLAPRVAREARLLVAEQMATSGPHQAVLGWRRSLGEAVGQTRRALADGRRAGAAMADLESLLPRLEGAVAGLDQELALLAAEPDPAVVDRVLRTDVGLRAERALDVAGRLRRAVGESLASANVEAIEDLAASAELSTTALSAALEELDRRRR